MFEPLFSKWHSIMPLTLHIYLNNEILPGVVPVSGLYFCFIMADVFLIYKNNTIPIYLIGIS